MSAEHQDRKVVLLRAAYDILKRSAKSRYVLSALEIQAHYDGTNCDGHCLMDDIMNELDLPDHQDPIPLKPEEGEGA